MHFDVNARRPKAVDIGTSQISDIDRPGMAARGQENRRCKGSMGQGHRAQHTVAEMVGHDPAPWQEFRSRHAVEVQEHPEQLTRLRGQGRKGPITLL
jgi:hypothetical protein